MYYSEGFGEEQHKMKWVNKDGASEGAAAALSGPDAVAAAAPAASAAPAAVAREPEPEWESGYQTPNPKPQTPNPKPPHSIFCLLQTAFSSPTHATG